MTNGTRRGWGFSVTPRPLFTPGKDPVPIVQEAGWASGPDWTGAENLAPTGIRSPDRPARSQSLYRLSYPAHLHSVRRNEFTFAIAACLFFPAWFQALWHFAVRYWYLVLFVTVLMSITSFSSTLYAFSALVLNWIRWSTSSSGHLQSVKWASNRHSREGLKTRSLPGTKQKNFKPIGSSVPTVKVRITR